LLFKSYILQLVKIEKNLILHYRPITWRDITNLIYTNLFEWKLW